MICVCFAFLIIFGVCPVFGSGWKAPSGHVPPITSKLVALGLSAAEIAARLVIATSNFVKVSASKAPKKFASAILSSGGFSLMKKPIFQGGKFLLIRTVLSREPGLPGVKRGLTAQRDLTPQLRFSGLRFSEYPKRSIS